MVFCLGRAVTNIVRHAKAAFVDVLLKTSTSDSVIRISDNGTSGAGAGVEACHQGTSGSSLWPDQLNERAALVGGRCEFISSPGIGSIVLARIPIR